MTAAYLVITAPTNCKWRDGAVVLARGPGQPAIAGDLFEVPAAVSGRFLAEFQGRDNLTWQFIDAATYAELCAVRDAAIAEAKAAAEAAEAARIEAERAEAERIAEREALEALVRGAVTR
jgi:hypothetical protein